jgi:phage shock protein C
LADYLSIPTFGIRAAALVLLICTGFWPVGALYLLAGLVLKSEPTWSY